jgi:hypothetical protein
VEFDFDIPIRMLTEDDEQDLPLTDEPQLPERVEPETLEEQLEQEKIHGHPAYEEPEPDYEPVDDSLDEDD